uniref:Chitinase 3 like 2 n=1 Tax=Equus caballus TaxID=9796 RepID=A0A9L0RUY9_HORSE
NTGFGSTDVSPYPSLTGLVVLLLLQGGSTCKLVCYFTNWSQDWQEPGKFTPENIDPFLCSHLIYAFASISKNKTINSLKTKISVKNMCYGHCFFFPKTPVLLPPRFHAMVDSSTSHLGFIKSVILFLRNRNFDGLDISWIYPDVKDNTDFTVLIHELAEAFQKDFVKSTRERLLLTAGVSSGRISSFAFGTLDFINLLSFDFHGSLEKPLITGHNSPLRKGQLDRGMSSHYNVEYAVGYWLNKGMPAEKMVMGIPMYGWSFTLASAETALGAPATGPGAAGPGAAGPITKSSGFLAYYENCTFLKNGAPEVWEAPEDAPCAYKGNEYLGYHDTRSFKIRVDSKKNFGGAMVWTVCLDDFLSTFCNQGKFPLITTLKDALGLLSVGELAGEKGH